MEVAILWHKKLICIKSLKSEAPSENATKLYLAFTIWYELWYEIQIWHIQSLSSEEVLVILQTTENENEPLPHNTSVIASVYVCDFITLLSKSTSWTCNRMQKKIADVLLKFCDLKPLPPKLEGLTIIYSLKKGNLWLVLA